MLASTLDIHATWWRIDCHNIALAGSRIVLGVQAEPDGLDCSSVGVPFDSCRCGDFEAAQPKGLSDILFQIRSPFKNRSFGERDFERERDEQMEIQRQIIADRRSGKRISEAVKRREAVKKAEQEKRADKERRKADPTWKSEREIEMDKKRAEAQKKEPKSGIIVPLPPFNIPEFDNGERFDLRAPYTDEGWVDESESPGLWGKLFGAKRDERESDSEGDGRGPDSEGEEKPQSK